METGDEGSEELAFGDKYGALKGPILETVVRPRKGRFLSFLRI